MRANSLWYARWVSGCVAAALLIFVCAAGPARAHAAAEAYIQKVADEATEILNSTTLSRSAKRDALSHMIDQRLDLDKIASFELGKYARVATDTERAEFKPLLKQYVINFYVNNLVNYRDVSLKILKSVDRGGKNGAIVETSISANGDAPAPADWWVIPSSGGLKIFDVRLEGIWVAQNLRSTLASVMDNGGGKVSAGIAELRKKVNAPAASTPAP